MHQGKVAKELLACNSQQIYMWDLETASLKSSLKCTDFRKVPQDYICQCKAIKRDPHNSSLLAFAFGKRFEIIDLRDPKASTINDSSCLHSSQAILDIDFNPIKVNTIVSTGQDSYIRFWDLRKMKSGECLYAYSQSDIFSQSLNSASMDKKISMMSNHNSASNSTSMLGPAALGA